MTRLMRQNWSGAVAASPKLDQLADAACLSVNHFIRAFHQHTGG
jgi:transcriptional regulator GlxA family with amidase domain